MDKPLLQIIMDLITRKIKIKNTNIVKGDNWIKVEVIADEGGGREISYSFFTKKKDGSPTKAFQYYQANKQNWDTALLMDEDLEVEIAYEEKPFVSKNSGKTYMGRTIKAFKGEPIIGQPIGDQNLAENRIYNEDDIPVIDDDDLGI